MSDRFLYVCWEPLSALRDEGLDDLISLHHAEVGLHKDRMPLDVDWEKYHELERLGILKLASCYAGDDLIGYASWMVMPHLHYRGTVHAMNDAVFIRDGFRGAGINLIRQCEKRLVRDHPGTLRIIYHVKLAPDYGPVLRRLGYTPFETCWDKLIWASD